MAFESIRGTGAIITGGGSGINLAFAKQLHSEGYHILIMDVNLHEDAASWLQEVGKTNGPTVYFHKASVTNWTELENVFDIYSSNIGGVPHLVCAGAGIYELSANRFWDDSDADGHYQIFDVNLLAPIKLTRIAIRRMLQHNVKGVVVHISSIAAQKPSIATPLYQSAKSAVSMFIKSMASLQDLAGVRVVGVAPGVIKTPIFLDHPETLKTLNLDQDFTLPPEEVARALMAVCMDFKYPPGTILEVTDFNNWRSVEIINDPGPQGKALLASNRDWILGELKCILKKDQDSKPGGFVE